MRCSVVTRYSDVEGIFVGIGAVGSERKNPVFSFNGVTMMLPWPTGIEQLDNVE